VEVSFIGGGHREN